MLFLDRSNARIDPSAITGGLTANDPNAIHVNVAAEISGISNKATPVAGDLFVIEDSASAFAKRNILFSALTAAFTQDLWETISSDSGSTTADIPTDTLSVLGGTGISTAIAGDALTITNTDLGSDATIQTAYNADPTVPQLVLNATPNPLTIDASVAGDIFAVRRSDALDMLRISDDAMSLGRSNRRILELDQPDGTGRFGFECYPDDFSITTATGNNFVFRTDIGRTITLNIPGGGGVGNDTAPGFCTFNHTARFEDTGFLFAAQLLVNAAVQVECATATVGPLYLFLDQYNTYADGGSRTCTQHNAMRAQPRWGPNINGGSITQTSVELYFAASTIDATVGSASITNCSHFVSKGLTLTAGGTVGEFKAFECEDIPAAGVTTSFGFWSDYSNADFFIRQTGTSISAFDGDIHMNNGVSLVLGTDGGNRVELLRPSAGVARMIGVGGSFNEGLDFLMDGVANVVELQSSTGAGLKISPSGAADAAATIALGDGLDPDGTANWWLAWAPGTRTVNLGGDWFDVLFSAGANVDLAGNAMGTVATMALNEPGITLSGGSVVTAATLFVANAPTEGSTNNNALRVGSGLTSLDDLETRAGSLLGFFGTTPAAQPPAYTPTNVVTDRAYDANATSVAELADVLGTLIADLQSLGIVA